MRSFAATLGVLLCAWSTHAAAQATGAADATAGEATAGEAATSEAATTQAATGDGTAVPNVPAPIRDPSGTPPPQFDQRPPPPPPPPSQVVPPTPAPHVPEAAPHYQQPPPAGPKRWQWDDGADDAGPSLHSGFYTHIQLMGGLFSAGDLTDGIEDGTGAAVAFGFSMWRDRLIGFLQFDILGDQSERSLGVGTLAIGMAYYLADPNLMFALEFGSTTVSYTDYEGEILSRSGNGAAVVVAREWPIDGGPLAVGALVRLRGAAIEGNGSYFGATGGLSITYH